MGEPRGALGERSWRTERRRTLLRSLVVWHLRLPGFNRFGIAETQKLTVLVHTCSSPASANLPRRLPKLHRAWLPQGLPPLPLTAILTHDGSLPPLTMSGCRSIWAACRTSYRWTLPGRQLLRGSSRCSSQARRAHSQACATGLQPEYLPHRPTTSRLHCGQTH